jgi:DNA-binding transcriptional LysR family regulator
MAGMELRHLRYFLAVAEERHITRAAQRLGIQQPPLSLQIRALEQELGVDLFTRGARGVELTAAGQTLREDATAILAAVQRATERATRAAAGHSGKLSLGVTTSAMLHPLSPAIIGAFRKAYPRVTLDLRVNPAADLTEALVRGDIRIALLRVPVARPHGVSFTELAREPLLAVLPTQHPMARKPALRLQDLASERFILVRRPDAPGLYENIVTTSLAAGFTPVVAAEVPNMLTSINLVSAGVGISFVPASMREVNLRQVAYVPIRARPPLEVPLNLAWFDRDEDPVALNFRRIAATDLLADPTPTLQPSHP